jgi:hypothetical protein
MTTSDSGVEESGYSIERATIARTGRGAGRNMTSGHDERATALDGRARQLPMRLIRPLAVAAAVLVIAALAFGVYRALSGPAALPAGQPLTILTEPLAYDGNACPMALRSSVQMRLSGSEVVFSQGGQDESYTWPYGTKALLVDGKAELFAPDRTLIATEGQTLPDLGGGLGAEGDNFHVCQIDGHSTH